jgi:hypothetical protein
VCRRGTQLIKEGTTMLQTEGKKELTEEEKLKLVFGADYKPLSKE